MMEDSPPINLVESMQKCERKSSPSVYFILSKFANVWKRSDIGKTISIPMQQSR